MIIYTPGLDNLCTNTTITLTREKKLLKTYFGNIYVNNNMVIYAPGLDNLDTNTTITLTRGKRC